MSDSEEDVVAVDVEVEEDDQSDGNNSDDEAVVEVVAEAVEADSDDDDDDDEGAAVEVEVEEEEETVAQEIVSYTFEIRDLSQLGNKSTAIGSLILSCSRTAISNTIWINQSKRGTIQISFIHCGGSCMSPST